MYIVLLLLLPGVRVEESTTLLASRQLNKLSFEPVKFVNSKKGPILFPNDGPPPTPKPLVVTSRPLIESIARSDQNNRLQVQSLAQSQVSSFTFRPNYLQEHTPYEFKLDTVTPNVLVSAPYNIDNHNAGHEEYNQSFPHKEVPQIKKKHKRSPSEVSVNLISKYLQPPDSESNVIAKSWSIKLNRLADEQRRHALDIITNVLLEGQKGRLSRTGYHFMPTNSSSYYI